jgi:hypothetical protein
MDDWKYKSIICDMLCTTYHKLTIENMFVEVLEPLLAFLRVSFWTLSDVQTSLVCYPNMLSIAFLGGHPILDPQFVACFSSENQNCNNAFSNTLQIYIYTAKDWRALSEKNTLCQRPVEHTSNVSIPARILGPFNNIFAVIRHITTHDPPWLQGFTTI